MAIEHARNDKGLTREDLAERIRKSERYVVAIEQGERTPSLKTCWIYLQTAPEQLKVKTVRALMHCAGAITTCMAHRRNCKPFWTNISISTTANARIEN